MLSATDGDVDDGDGEAAAVDFDNLVLGLMVAFAIAIAPPLDCYWQRPCWLPYAVQKPLFIIEETRLNRLMIFFFIVD